MNILAVGDIVGTAGQAYLRQVLPGYKMQEKIDFVIVNGENASDHNGISPRCADFIFASGADIITGGNHSFRRAEICDYLDANEFILRPANFDSSLPGRGICCATKGRLQICVINLMGTLFMESLENPFTCIDRILQQVECPCILIDFHAEATSEKIAFARYVDGRVSAVFGTHTHVQTADAQIFPGGTGYITDLGMTGPIHSVLGMDIASATRRLRFKVPTRFSPAEGSCALHGILFQIDDKTGKTSQIRLVNL